MLTCSTAPVAWGPAQHSSEGHAFPRGPKPDLEINCSTGCQESACVNSSVCLPVVFVSTSTVPISFSAFLVPSLPPAILCVHNPFLPTLPLSQPAAPPFHSSQVSCSSL